MVDMVALVGMVGQPHVLGQTFLSGFYLATKIWGESVINEWAYLACQVIRTYL